MATAKLQVTLRVRDMARTRLFALQLQFLVDEMRVAADPYAERLETLVDRYLEGGDDEHGEPVEP